MWGFPQKWTNVNLTHVQTGPLVSVRTTHTSVYVHLNTKDGIATKVSQAITFEVKVRYFTTKLLPVPLVTRQKHSRRLFMAVSIRTEVVSTSVQRLKIQSISVTVLLATAWRLTTEAACHKVGFGIIKISI